MRARALLVGALVLVGVDTMAAANPAQAECIEVTFEVHKEGEPHWDPLGGPESCVTGTPWTQGQEADWGVDHTPMPSGMPKGFWFKVWVPGP